MKISEKQLQMLMVILQDSQKNIVGLFSYDLEARNKLLNAIVNQQSDKLIDIEDKENNK
jgi:hypothetical protein